MNSKWKVAIGLVCVVALMFAQQPVLLQDPSTSANRVAVSSTGAASTNASQWAGTTLGAPSNYGTSPGAVEVPGVNAFVTNTIAVSLTPSASSTLAMSSFHVVGSTSTFSSVKASAGNVFGGQIYNPNSTPCYLVFYNSAAPTIGTTAEVYAMGIQAGTTQSLPAGPFALANFSTAITIAGTTTDGGSTVCTTGMSINLWYF